MDRLEDKRQKANDLRKNKNYEKALELYRDLWTEYRDKCSEWEGWGFASCLRKLGKHEKALEICREVYRIKPDFKINNNLYAWCIYDAEIKQENEIIQNDEKRFLKAAGAIIKLTSQEEYSPYSKTILKVAHYLSKTKVPFPANEIIGWLDQLNENNLSKEPFIISDQEAKQKESPSEKERWYLLKSKSLIMRENYQDCIHLCESALSEFDKLHYGGEIWLKRRIALCKNKLSRKEEAAEDLELILLQRKEWFMQYELAKIYFELEKNEKALNKAIEAALNAGKDENKWELFTLLARLLTDRRMDMTKSHILYAAKLRMEKKWKIPEVLSQEIKELNLDINDTINIRELRSKLKKFWENEKFASQPQMRGTVKKILKNGKAGFISGSDGKDYFFKTGSFKDSANKLTEGLKVSYLVEDSYDIKKKKHSKCATHIRKVKSIPSDNHN